MNKIYKCECGKEFDNPQRFNGHKSHCKIHLTTTGRLNIREDIDSNHGNKVADKLSTYYKQLRESKIAEWVLEKHHCKTCGKVMTTMYGAGIYCSRKCANTRVHSSATRSKIRNSIKAATTIDDYYDTAKKRYGQRVLSNYYKNKKYYVKSGAVGICKCVVCGKLFKGTLVRKVCSETCRNILSSISTKRAIISYGGNLNTTGYTHCKKGYYNGIHCDSSWELAFLVYNIEHNVSIKRCDEFFTYFYNGKESNYFPDFIVDDMYIEIKNYWTKQVQAKMDQFPKDKKYKILYWNDMEPYIDYCIKKYGKHYWEVLYR